MMGLLFKIAALALILLIFAYCFRKKNSNPNLKSWLEEQYPGRFVVLDTQMSDPIKNLSFKVKNSVVAEKADTLVQAIVKWDKRQPGLDVNRETIDASFERAAIEIKDARALYSMLDAAGLKHFATGVRNGSVYVLSFEELHAEQRLALLSKLEKAYAKWPEAQYYNKEILLMEPSEENNGFQQIIPLTYWFDSGGLYIKKVIFQLICKYNEPFKAKKLEQDWTFNNRCDRFDQYYKQASDAAQQWADAHYTFETKLLDTSTFEQDSSRNTIGLFDFELSGKPAKATTEPESLGHLIVSFDLEKKTVEQVLYRKN